MKNCFCRTSSQSDPNRAKYGAFVKAATPNWDFGRRDSVRKASSKTQTTPVSDIAH